MVGFEPQKIGSPLDVAEAGEAACSENGHDRIIPTTRATGTIFKKEKNFVIIESCSYPKRFLTNPINAKPASNVAMNPCVFAVAPLRPHPEEALEDVDEVVMVVPPLEDVQTLSGPALPEAVRNPTLSEPDGVTPPVEVVVMLPSATVAPSVHCVAVMVAMVSVLIVVN